MVDKEMLTAMSEMMDQKFDEKLKPVYGRLDRLDGQLENNVIPRLDRLDGQLENNVIPRLDRLDEQLESNVIPRLDKVESDMRYVRVVLLENKIIPQLNTVHSLYLETSNKYNKREKQIDKMSEDVAVLNSVVSNHSTRLNKLSV